MKFRGRWLVIVTVLERKRIVRQEIADAVASESYYPHSDSDRLSILPAVRSERLRSRTVSACVVSLVAPWAKKMVLTQMKEDARKTRRRSSAAHRLWTTRLMACAFVGLALTQLMCWHTLVDFIQESDASGLRTVTPRQITISGIFLASERETEQLRRLKVTLLPLLSSPRKRGPSAGSPVSR